MKPGAELLPRHPASGVLPYRNWIGIVLGDPAPDKDGLRLRAAAIEGFFERHGRQAKRMIAAGWAMDNMKPKDFLWAELPLLPFDTAAQTQAEALIGAADAVAFGLRRALPVLIAEGTAREAQLDQFWAVTEGDFTAALARLAAPGFDAAALSRDFLTALGRQALAQFDALALPGLSEARIEHAGKVVAERRMLAALVHGRSKPGQTLWRNLGLEPPERPAPARQEAEA